MMSQFHCHIRFGRKIGPIEASQLFSKFNEAFKICLPGHIIFIIYFVILVSEEHHYDRGKLQFVVVAIFGVS